jgi:hypothetical protein
MLLDPVLNKECLTEKKFTKKMTSGGITDNYATNALSMGKI